MLPGVDITADTAIKRGLNPRSCGHTEPRYGNGRKNIIWYYLGCEYVDYPFTFFVIAWASTRILICSTTMDNYLKRVSSGKHGGENTETAVICIPKALRSPKLSRKIYRTSKR